MSRPITLPVRAAPQRGSSTLSICAALSLLSVLATSSVATAHHDSSSSLGQSAASGAPFQGPTGRPPSASTRYGLSQSVYSVPAMIAEDGVLSERSVWWWSRLAGTLAIGSDVELGLSLPFATRFPGQFGESSDSGFGDVRLDARAFLQPHAAPYTLSVGTELSMPTGRDQDGFTNAAFVQHLGASFRYASPRGGMLFGADLGAAWSYEHEAQVAADARALIASPLFWRMRASLAFSSQLFFLDSPATLQSLPAQQRQAGDALFLLSPALLVSPGGPWVLMASVDLPVSEARNFDWSATLAVQYWINDW